MKFKIDQNLPVDFVPILQQAGHEALTLFEQQLSGARRATLKERPS